MANKRKVAPEKHGGSSGGGEGGNTNRARGNWGVLAGQMNQGQLRNNQSMFSNGQKGRMSNGGGGEGGGGVWVGSNSGTQPSWKSGAIAGGYPNFNNSNNSNKRVQNDNGRMEQLNVQLRDEPGGIDAQNRQTGKTGQVTFRDESVKANTPSDLMLSDKPKQPPVWQASGADGKQGGGNGLKSGWQPPQRDFDNEGQGQENIQGQVAQSGGQQQQHQQQKQQQQQWNPTRSDQPPSESKWTRILFDL